MARAIDADELEMFPYSEGSGTEEQIAEWIEQVGLSEEDTADRARLLCWKVIEGCINVVKTQPTLTPPNEPLTIEQLREMGGQPYWHVGLQEDSKAPHWVILDPFFAKHIENYGYGERWLAYRRPPEGEEDHHG